MYAHSNSTFSNASDFISQPQLPLDVMITPSPLPSTPLMHPSNICQYQLVMNEFDSVHEALRVLNSEVSNNNSSSSGCSSAYESPSSLACYETQRSGSGLIPRSVSSHSLQKNGAHHPVSALFSELLNSEKGPVRKAYSTGDLQRINMMQRTHRSESPLSSESSMIIEGMSRACPYTPEEKKERIERYRTKRNQRNFNKKIKYVCRKTLADSRPRIRGRFAKNEETEKNPSVEWSHIGHGGEEEEDDDNWINFLDAFSANLVQ
ncbi:zinc finger protein CONSTANS-like [Quillaja saponaria]|uniref:Zinc finger protein CONSTANS-like n=1 Tax=Quillaja saponaria TaxID=32244 RepID=A0AAD7KXJ8_QUISA|nr:zinc finger protein CONSTANS-like [Quillaja saponaria]